MNCRHCGLPLEHLFLDLGSAPLSNAYLNESDLDLPEAEFPLRVFVCEHCWLVQTEDYVCSDAIFTKDYAYFSSTSAGWLKHAENFCSMIRQRLSLDTQSFIVELGCNDGYLLKNLVADNIPCLGVEPTNSTAAAAEAEGIEIDRAFFDEAYAKSLVAKGRQADLIIGNNVLAHVPDINDFTMGLKRALKPNGTITIEFPHLLNLIRFNQFDTVYHEHYSYLSLYTVQKIFKAAGLMIYDVEQLNTHGGSLRIYAGHEQGGAVISQKVTTILAAEKNAGLHTLDVYQVFQAKVDKVRDDLRSFLIEQKRLGKKVVGYGAAAKGNTLLNYAGIKTDLLPFVCDAAPSKQGRYMPGSHIPILKPSEIEKQKPDFIMILPWNIADEVMRVNASVAEWGCCFVIAVPRLKFFETINEDGLALG